MDAVINYSVALALNLQGLGSLVPKVESIGAMTSYASSTASSEINWKGSKESWPLACKAGSKVYAYSYMYKNGMQASSFLLPHLGSQARRGSFRFRLHPLIKYVL